MPHIPYTNLQQFIQCTHCGGDELKQYFNEGKIMAKQKKIKIKSSIQMPSSESATNNENLKQ